MSAAEALAAPVVTMRPATSTPVTPTAIATPTPQPTATSQPTTTPLPRSTTAAGDTATPRAAATVTAAATIDRADGNASNVPTRTPGGPTSVTIVGPASGLSNVQGERVTFTWTANEALEAGQGFELHFWQEAEPREMGRTLFGASPDPSVTFAPDITGTRKWGVWLVTINPYKEIRYLGGDNLITISGPPEKEPRKPGPAAPPDPGGGGTRP